MTTTTPPRPPVSPDAMDATVYLSPEFERVQTDIARQLARAQGHAVPDAPGGGGGGGGMYMRRGRWLTGGNGTGGGTEIETADYEIDGGGGGGGMTLGYIAHENRFLRVYPLIEFGGSGEGVSYERRGASEADEIAAGRGGVQMRVGFGVEWRVKLFWRFGVMVGVRVGLRWLPFYSDWQGDRADEVAKIATARATGWTPFAQFMFGATMTGSRSAV